jgi:hypothetical protein
MAVEQPPDPNDGDLSFPDPDFREVLDTLAGLSRNHLLYFRVHAGRTISFAFYRNNRKGYHDRSNTKANSLHRFATEHKGELADLGLTEAELRDCLKAWWVVEDLGHAVSDQLRYSHILALGRLDDPATRRTLAQAALDNGWRGDAMKNAVIAVKSGKWIDAKPDEPGLQPPDPAVAGGPKPEGDKPTDTRPLAPGRVVTRVEKAATTLDAVCDEWEQLDLSKLTKLQRTRAMEAANRMAERAAAFKARLAG